ncbi:MAG: SsrA-binding protein SmpB [Crenarchaeota archaeon]|nr:MAG: SsrA-binding protein SmpB [Thermoproteota archaeon]
MSKSLCQNRKARHDYQILDTVEAGIVLIGCEVKSLLDHKASLDGSYAIVEDGEVWLVNSHIDEYKNKSTHVQHEPKRRRKLLLKKREIHKFAEQAKQKGHTLVPLSFYLNNGKVKVNLAVAKGKQLHDKREALKKRDAEREMQNGK